MGKGRKNTPHNGNTSGEQKPTWSGGQSCGAWGMLRSGRRLRKTKSTPQLQPAANPPAGLGLNLELQGKGALFLAPECCHHQLQPQRGLS